MDDELITALVNFGYKETSHVSEGGEIVKAVYVNDEGHSVDLYHKKFMHAFEN